MSNQVVAKQNKCVMCGCAIDRQSKFCIPCSHIAQRKVERPDAEQLKQEIITLKGFEAVGRKYGVSGNAIKKWCKNYGLSTYAKDYKEDKKRPTYPIRKVAQINKDTEEVIKIWDNCADAARGVGGNNSHITEVCNGIHKTAYGYKWKYVD